MVEAGRMRYIRAHQKTLRCELYSGLADALMRGETESSTQGKRVILPSSFTGGPRYMIQNYQDAMAICRWVGYPDLFITFTCNPKWPEISRFVDSKGLHSTDRPDIVSRIFKMKLDMLMKDIRKKSIFGEVAAVRDFMIHGPCGTARLNSPCMSKGRCTKHFPKKYVPATTIDEDGYPMYRRREDGRVIERNGISLDNRFVVPHNRYLLLKYGAHINVEWCNQSWSIKYMFKYVNKGHDRVTASFYKTAVDEDSGKNIDEVSMYYNCRYISPCEATWRILKFDVQFRNPAVERLSFHLDGHQTVVFSDDDPIADVVNRPSVRESMFTAWMEANKKYEEARQLTYTEFPIKFVWIKKTREWKPRKKGYKIGRLFFVPPSDVNKELYYLRFLLNIVRGATSYQSIRCINGVQYSSYREACYSLGLLDDDKEYIDGIVEASSWSTGNSLRQLFATLLSTGCMNKPEEVWTKCWIYLCEDIERNQRRMLQHEDLQLTEEQKKDYALAEIESFLRKYGRSLFEFPSMPMPNSELLSTTQNVLIHEELQYDRQALHNEHLQLLSNMNDEQRDVYDTIIKAVDSNSGGVFFVYGYGGTGKTFVWKTLSAAIRSKGNIVLNVESSGIASLLLPGGRTAHSRFAIPINVNEDSTCNIKQNSQLADLIIACKLIIWDEAPMMQKYCFEALDKTMKDILRLHNTANSQRPFGGKTIVLGGDFRQILPVVPKGTRQDIVGATINSSYLWKHFKVLRLTKNMRLRNCGSPDELQQLKQFADWIASIGDGTIGDRNDGDATIDILEDILLNFVGDPIAAIVEATFPSFNTSMNDSSYLVGRSILAPTLDIVEGINEYMTSLNIAESKTYLSSDNTCASDSGLDILQNIHTPEFLNAIKCSGVPNHSLHLKVGTPVMLLRNIYHTRGLCNGTRLVLTRLGTNVLEAKILGSTNDVETVLLPRMSLTPSDPRLPFKFNRRQFPFMVSYAMTINKSQGQSLSHVGLLLKKPVFSHGQLYVVVSRVTNRKGLKILVCDDNGKPTDSTTNVVFKEVFQNL